jgi:hypothetical protein
VELNGEIAKAAEGQTPVNNSVQVTQGLVRVLVPHYSLNKRPIPIRFERVLKLPRQSHLNSMAEIAASIRNFDDLKQLNLNEVALAAVRNVISISITEQTNKLAVANRKVRRCIYY